MEAEQVDPAAENLPAVIEHEANTLTAQAVADQAALIVDVMEKSMRKGVDYGTIPGCQKPSLWQPGAEKLCVLFRFAATYAVDVDHDPEASREWEKYSKKTKKTTRGTCKGFMRASVTCTLRHMPTGWVVSQGVGTANNWEPKFIGRDPYEVEETVLQFARKRALVNAARTATAASDIFTQDLEDQPGFHPAHSADHENARTSGEGIAPLEDDTAFMEPSAKDVETMRNWLSGPGNMTDAAYDRMWTLWRAENYHDWPDVPDMDIQLAYAQYAAQKPAPTGPPVCPTCKGAMWDNRGDRAADKAAIASGERESKPRPAWKCKDDNCGGILWQSDGSK